MWYTTSRVDAATTRRRRMNDFDDTLRAYWADRGLERRTFTKNGQVFVESICPLSNHKYKGWFYNREDNKFYRWNDRFPS